MAAKFTPKMTCQACGGPARYVYDEWKGGVLVRVCRQKQCGREITIGDMRYYARGVQLGVVRRRRIYLGSVNGRRTFAASTPRFVGE